LINYAYFDRILSVYYVSIATRNTVSVQCSLLCLTAVETLGYWHLKACINVLLSLPARVS